MPKITIEDLKAKTKITRQDIADLLKSIDKPGRKKREKIEAVESLGRTNPQGANISAIVPDFEEF